jgi:hypothetical protein
VIPRYFDLVIRAKRPGMMLPLLETILSEFGRRVGQHQRRFEDNLGA